MPVAPSRATSRWVEMMMTSTRSLLLASCVLVLAGCGVDDNGMILVVDHSYVPAVAVTTSDGITTPDGILWWHGKLIMADEGGCALRVWLSLIHISEPTRQAEISYAVFCLKKKKK